MMPKRRTILRLAVFLLLGAAVNVAVAWVLMLRPPRATLDANGSVLCLAWHEAPGGTIGVDARRGYLLIRQTETLPSPEPPQSTSFGITVGSIDAFDFRQNIDGPAFESMVPAGSAFSGRSPLPSFMHLAQRGDNWIRFTEHLSGLPMLAMRYTSVERSNGSPRTITVERSAGMFVARASSGKMTILPFLPIWPGFAINTVFYAGICWLLVAAPFAFRRLRAGRRIKRGLCPACTYPVGMSEICTECGKQVRPRSVEPPT